MIGRGGVLATLAGLAALVPAPARGHEERLMVGTVVQIEPARKLLVVRDAQRDEQRRLEVNAESEVVMCGMTAGLASLATGSLVRIKYLDRAGRSPELLSVLVLGSGHRR